MSTYEYVKKAAQITPSKRQLALQEMEFYGFIHFTVNTFTDNEWGLGDESPEIFNPSQLDADQWVEACKSAGMTGLLLTCKHHDGFCLWPSQYTDHSVKNSPWKNGTGDVVKEVADACRRGGIKFGVYLSPWDRHEKTYGDSPTYNMYFKNQLKELLTNYGDIFCVWFDGACGEGPNGKRQVYDWEGYFQVIRELQPDAVISICGPDVRWCGNEAGHCRESEWSVVPLHLRDAERTQEKSQKVDDGEFTKKINSEDADLGSRDVIKDEKDLAWYPAEVDTSIRPGWFYHASEDEQVKSLDELLRVYNQSVGGNATLLLNIPPDRRGLIHENDMKRLKEFGEVIKKTYADNLADGAVAEASEIMNDKYSANNIVDNNKETYWAPCEGTEKAVVTIDLKEDKTFDRVVMKEHIQSGQRIEKFKLEYKEGDIWKELYNGTVVGYKRICCFDKVSTRYIQLTITESRWYPTISSFGVYRSV